MTLVNEFGSTAQKNACYLQDTKYIYCLVILTKL